MAPNLALLTSVLVALSGNPHVHAECVTSEVAWAQSPLPLSSAYTQPTIDTVWFGPGVCPVLRQLNLGRINRSSVNVDQAAAALLTVAHESGHLSGITDEGVTECRATKLLGKAAVLFGATRARAHELVASALWIHRLKPPAYLTVC